MKQFIKDGVLTKYEKESSKLRMGGGSWTINLDEVSLESLTKIVYITNRYRYSISKKWAIEYGWTKLLGGENKLVVPIKFWIKDAILF
jgi:sorbitol-specific phosphotransferase system component IIBC|tara:strand:- start:13365 stop:13628 length:264 start_codon:yes stop_codon:yes gene_type:complete